MTPVPYVRLRPEDLRGSSAVWGWTLAAPELVEALGLPAGRAIALPLAGRRVRGARERHQVREGLASLLALEPSHPDRTLYLEIVLRSYPGYERWLERRVARGFASGRCREVLREAVALVNLFPGRGEARFNLGLLLARIVSRDPDGPHTRRWAALARGEFARAAELSPELFWGLYHRGVLAYEAVLPKAAQQDWLRFLDRYFADKPAPRGLTLPLLPLNGDDAGAELPGLAYTVLLDLLGLLLPRRAPSETSHQTLT